METDAAAALLVTVLAEIVRLLQSDGEQHWYRYIDDCRNLLLTSDAHGLEKLLSAYGGMGSFSDVVVGYSDKDRAFKPEAAAQNEQLDRLRIRAYELARSLRRGT